MKFIILCTIFILSSFWCFPSFAMQYEQTKVPSVTNGLTCEGCQEVFAQPASRVRHIISTHYSCPWCNGLDYLDLGFWKYLSQADRQARVNHIKACAEKKSASLWQCKKCLALFHYKDSRHSCGVQHQENIISQSLNSEKDLQAEQEKTYESYKKNFGHDRGLIKNSCNGEVYGTSAEIISNSYVTENEEWLLSVQESSSPNQFFDQQSGNLFGYSSNQPLYIADTPIVNDDLNFLIEQEQDAGREQLEQRRKFPVTNGNTCEKCHRKFIRAERRLEHILNLHYACPWCDYLDYLDSGVWKSISEEKRQARVNHIKACTKKKRTSLWQCKQCFELSHYKNKEHRCGVQYQVNLITNKGLDVNEVLKISEMNTCRVCNKSLVHARGRKNHMILRHTACPWCPIKPIENSKPYTALSHDERQVPFTHFIECAQRNNESLFACNTCYGIKVSSRFVHISKSCKGDAYQASENVKRNSDTIQQEDQLGLIQESSLTSQCSDAPNGDVLSCGENELFSIADAPIVNEDLISLIEQEQDSGRNELVQRRKFPITNGNTTCQGCLQKFKTGELRIMHIINLHYACPWCDYLDYLDSGVWKLLSQEEQQARVNHIKACAGEKNTSLWQCKNCFALFHYKNKEHRCGIQHQVNLVTNKGLALDEVLKISEMSTCRVCNKMLVNAKARKNHMILRHTACPWCPIQLIKSFKSYTTLSLDERQIPFTHFIECALRSNESLFACNTCYGVKLSCRFVHMPISCKGDAYKASEKIKKNSHTIQKEEPLRLVQESSLTNQYSDEKNGDVLSSGGSELVFTTNSLTKKQDQSSSGEEVSIEELLRFCNGDGAFLS